MKRGIPAIDILVCNLCLNDLFTRIYQCKNGHSYCEACYNDNLGCNLCKTAILPFRNRVIEEVTTEIKIPCKWKQCTEAVPCNLLAAHERNCKFKLIQCSLCIGFVTYQPDKIIKHVESRHNITFQQTEQPFSIGNTFIKSPVYEKGIKINDIFIILKCRETNDHHIYVTFQTLDYRRQTILVRYKKRNTTMTVAGGEASLIHSSNREYENNIMVSIQ